MSLSNQKIKLIKSLKLKKFRQKYGFFVAEGQNIAKELSKDQGKHYDLVEAFYVQDDSAQFFEKGQAYQITNKELQKISLLKNPFDCLMVLRMPSSIEINELGSRLFYLDEIQDPGNMGTIIRIANWFGFDGVIRSQNSVDFYNPKVIQASMGGFIGTSLLVDDGSVLTNLDHVKLAMDMSGDSLFEMQMPKKIICIIGNEGKGISIKMKTCVDHFVSIPSANQNLTIDSLNAAVSAGVFAAYVSN